MVRTATPLGISICDEKTDGRLLRTEAVNLTLPETNRDAPYLRPILCRGRNRAPIRRCPGGARTAEPHPRSLGWRECRTGLGTVGVRAARCYFFLSLFFYLPWVRHPRRTGRTFPLPQAPRRASRSTPPARRRSPSAARNAKCGKGGEMAGSLPRLLRRKRPRRCGPAPEAWGCVGAGAWPLPSQSKPSARRPRSRGPDPRAGRG